MGLGTWRETAVCARVNLATLWLFTDVTSPRSVSLLKFLLPNVINPAYWHKSWLDVSLAWQLFRDPRVPTYLKGIPVIVALYLLSPLDIIPGFLPVIGQLDDFALLLLGVATFNRLAPDEVVLEYRPPTGE